MQVPSVTTQTIDNTSYIPYFTNEIACFCGTFEKGPINEPVFITSINELKDIFGQPKIGTSTGYSKDWYQVYNYLQYSSGIYVTRTSQDPNNANAVGIYDNRSSVALTPADDLYIDNGLIPDDGMTSALTPEFDLTPTLTLMPTEGGIIDNTLYFKQYVKAVINSYDDFNDNFSDIYGLSIFAQSAGLWGNDISVAIIQKAQWDENVFVKGTLKASDIFPYFSTGYVGLCVFDGDNLVESWYQQDLDDISLKSKYIFLKDNLPRDNQILNGKFWYGTHVIKLKTGFDIFADEADLVETYNLFANKDEYDIDIIIGNDTNNQAAIDLAEARRDCIAFIGLPTSIVDYIATEESDEPILTPDYYPIAAVTRSKFSRKVSEAQALDIFRYIEETVTQSQFACFTINIKEQYDIFNGKTMVCNIAADVAGLKAQASKNTPWTTGAGLERGRIKNATAVLVQFPYPGVVYDRGINFIDARGTLMSQRTFITEQTSFNRVNIRSLFNHIEKECDKLLRYYVFEFNDRQMRGQIASTIKQYLEKVKAARGIDAGKVIVKGDKNKVIIDVYIKPTYVAEFIQLRMTNTGRESVSQYLIGNL